MIIKLKGENIYKIFKFFHVMKVSCVCGEMYLGMEDLFSAINPHLHTPVVT
jgi:hypothetical protein